MHDLKDICRCPELLRRANGYWTLLRPGFAAHLNEYLSIFERYRDDLGIVPSDKHWEQLPFGSFANDSSWKWRRQSLAMFANLANGRQFGTTLEIGSWNGWLTRHLAKQSDSVVAADYFTANRDGIGNIEILAPNILAMQCELEQIYADFNHGAFDLIVLNHNLAYTQNPVGFIQNLIPLLKPGGRIISLGNTVFDKPSAKIRSNNATADAFQKKYGIPLYIAPLKGYLDENDLTLLGNSGFRTIGYPKMWLRKWYSKINRHAPAYFALEYQTKNGNA